MLVLRYLWDISDGDICYIHIYNSGERLEGVIPFRRLGVWMRSPRENAWSETRTEDGAQGYQYLGEHVKKNP